MTFSTRMGRPVRALVTSLPGSIFMPLCALFANQPRLRRLPGWVLGKQESDRRLVTRFRVHLWEEFSVRYSAALFVVRWLAGIRLLAFPNVETCRALYISGDYEPNELWHLYRMLAPGMVFVDVGANLGLYALFAAVLVGERGIVIAIEPSTREFSRLKANIELNRLSNIRAVNVALSDRSTELELNVFSDEHSGHNTLGRPRYPGILPERLERVSSQTLDDLIKTLNLWRVDVIKIDVEGHELQVLRGSMDTLKRHRPVVLIEILDGPPPRSEPHTAQAFDMLDEAGYLLFEYDESTALLRAPATHTGRTGNFVALPRECESVRTIALKGQVADARVMGVRHGAV